MRKNLTVLSLLLLFIQSVSAQTGVLSAPLRTGTITINGNPNESNWVFNTTISKPIIGTSNNTATMAVLWDNQYLYLAFRVTDGSKYNESTNPWDDDAIEIYIDADNNGGTTYGTNDRQFMKEWNNSGIWEKNNRTSNVTHAWANTSTGYTMEIRIAWSNMAISNPQAGRIIGFDVACDDDDNGGTRESQVMWNGDGDNWQYPRNFGDLILQGNDTQAPTIPTGLAIANLTQSTLTLTWNASTDNVGVSGYDIYQNGVKLNNTLIPTTTYSVSGLAASTNYSFYVQAKDANGNSAQSSTVSVVTPDEQAPTAPTNLQASGISQESLQLSWSVSTDNVGVVGYDIFQDGVLLNTSPVIVTNFAVTGLTAATSYQFLVRAKDAAGNVSGNSNTLTSTTLPPADTEAPAVVTGLQASAVGEQGFTLSWSPSTDNMAVTGYDIYQNGIKINSSPIAGVSIVINGLTAEQLYIFYVIARDAAGNSSTASEDLEITIPDTTPPSAPANLSASGLTATGVTIQWQATSDNVGVTGYDLFQNGIQLNTSIITSTNFTISGLNQATTYSFTVRALDAAGNISAFSNSLAVTTTDIEAPTAPGSLSSSALTFNSVTLNWMASTDNVGVTGYRIFRNGVQLTTTAASATSYSASGLTASTAYTFYLQAIDAAGNLSDNSNIINISTPVAPGCTGTGTIRFQRWNNLSGTSVTNLTSASSYPNSPTTSGTLTSFEIPTNSGDNYGMKVSGYICPPTTGNYTFWIASDDNAELWLSTNSNPSARVRIAYHTQWTNSREWNKYPTQKSAAISLVAGQLYYVEALMKEGSQGDNMAVGWAKPGQGTTTPGEVIPGSQLLASIPDTQAPGIISNLAASNITQTSVLLTWTAATDNIGVTGYDIYRDGVKVNGTLVTGTNYTATGLIASGTYSFSILARDAAGNSGALSAALQVTTLDPAPGYETFTQRTVIANQRMPHDLVYGPDNMLWYTERFAGTVSFVNPATGVKRVVLTLGSLMRRTGGQDGLMGLALHPAFLQGKPYVYISYTYESTSATLRKTRIVRYTYNSTARILEEPVTILENIPGSNDHNSSRLAIGPDEKLYFTVGDMGAGQFDNMSRTNNAQNLNILEGKVLRLNTEQINNSWIPADNPFTNAGVPTSVYTFGHRNAQGLVWGKVNGVDRLYSSEHGPYSDDEINIIESGRNYGWPLVAGFCDGNYNGRTIGGFAVVNEQNNCVTLNSRQPIRSLFPAVNPPTGGDNMTWPSTGPSGTDFYGSTAIPGWENSLLVAQLKNGTVTRLKLSNDGLNIISDTIHYFRGKGRFRDVVVSADGLKIYVACDSSGSTSGPTGGVTSTPANPGSILEFTYLPSAGRGNTQGLITQTTGPSQSLDRNIEVYPNPASQFFVVYNYQQKEGLQMQLIDLNGKAVMNQRLPDLANRVNVTSLSKGLYVLKVTDNTGKMISNEKILIR